MDGWLDGWMDGQTDGSIDRRTDGRMDRWTCKRSYSGLYACLNISLAGLLGPPIIRS